MMSLLQFPLSILEKLANCFYQLDPALLPRFKAFRNKALLLEITLPSLKIFVIPGQNGLSLSESYEGIATAKITGSLLNFFHLALIKDQKKSQQILREHFTISGDIEFIQDFKNAVDSLDIDWEEHLSRVTGDVLAHEVNQNFKKLFSWQEGIQKTFTSNMSEYLQEEIQCFPPREELKDFFNESDSLRDDVERLAARIYLLQQKIGNNHEAPTTDC